MKQSFNKTSLLSTAGLALCLMAVLSACKKDFLDRQPQGSFTSDTYPYPSGAGPYDANIFGAYAAMRKWGFAAFPELGATAIRSDDSDKGSNAGDGPDQIQMDQFPVTPTNGLVNDLWKAHYDVIARCNEVIDKISKDNNPASTPFKAQGEAEAKFIRGYSYFMLVRCFGGVPKLDSVYANIPNKPRATANEIYAFIESDLSFAAANLPPTWSASFVGRATSGAANGILAKVYLTRQNWAMAMSTAALVINSGVYDLSTPFHTIFTEDGENSKESVFELQAIATASFPSTEDYGIQYTNVQGVRGSGSYDLGWGFNVPSSYLEAAFDANDPRKERTFLRQGETTYYGETIPTGLDNPAYNEKVYTNPAIRNSVGNRFGWWMNVRLLRYADVVLMYAEAANELGGTANTTEALEKLEWVRARARAGNAGVLPEITTTDQGDLRNAIRKERRLELAMEHDRFFDLVRWGIAASTLQASGRPNFNGARDQVLPIPQAQRDISGGVLEQNPNY